MLTKSDRLNDDDLVQIEDELDEILAATPQEARELLTNVVLIGADAFARNFYEVMSAYPQGGTFLHNEIVHKRLHAGLVGGLRELFNSSIRSGEQIRKHQMEVGAIHARAKVPVSLVMRGFREIKRNITSAVLERPPAPEVLADTINLLTRLLDIALAIMTAAYVRHAERVARSDEALRLYSVGQDLAAERERQRAGVLEWAQLVLFDALLPTHNQLLPMLGRSEFGLWFTHRAEILFGRSQEYESAVDAIERCDDLIEHINHDIGADRVAIVRSLKDEVGKLNSLLSLMFDDVIGVTSARDPLTKLLSKQFVTTAVSREIGLAQMGRPGFCLVTFSFDPGDVRRVSSELEGGWDDVLRRAAQIVLGLSRSSDSAFRLNDHTILVVRVESDTADSRLFAEEVVLRVDSSHYGIGSQTIRNVQMAYRVTEFDGHPDPRHIIRLAEQRSDAEELSA